MKKNLTLFLIFSLFCFTSVFAQWPPCTNGTQLACKCSTAPLLCTIDQLDGYSFDMSSYQHPQDGPNPLCMGTNVPNNPTWFAFTAWCTNLELFVDISNCTGMGGSNGVQIGVYSSCSPYVAVACNVMDCGNTNDKSLSMSGLIIGGTYYFMIDGCAGSYCHVDIDVVGTCGNAEIGPWPGTITGPTVFCKPGSGMYSIQKPTGADFFHWYLNGTSIYDGPNNSVTVNWSTPGIYELCVDAYNNPCVPETNFPEPQCITIEVFAPLAGVVNAAPTPTCPGNDISYNVTGYQMDAAYTQVVLITNAAGQIVAVNPGATGVFNSPTCGNFTIYSYNYLTAGNSPVPTVGMNISAINCNTAQCCELKSKAISFVDNQAPTFVNPPPNQTLVCYDLLQPMEDLAYTDNCLPNGTKAGNETGMANMCNGGVITRTWTITDNCNNTKTHTQTITVTAAPVANFVNPPGNQTVSCANIPTSAPNLNYTNNGVGGCLVSGSAMPTTTGTADLCGGSLTNTWTFTDQCGNPKTHTQVITVTPTPPAAFINPPANKTVDCNNLPGPPPDLFYTNNQTGACLIAGSVPASITGMADICGGVLTYTWTFTDQCGRTISHVQTVTVTQIPQASFVNPPGNQTVSCANIPTTTPDLNYTNGGVNNCLIAGAAQVNSTGTIDLCGGVRTNTWTFTDQCGRTINHVQTITATPVPEANFINPPPNQTVNCANIPTSAPDLTYTNNLSGACLIQGTSQATMTGSADLCGGTIFFTWTFTDACGRSKTHVQTVTVTPVPQATFINPPGNQVVNCENIPTGPPPPLSYTNNLTGACAIQGQVTADITGGADLCGGTIIYTYTFTDACNRVLVHVQTITANKVPIPTFTNPPADITVQCENIPAAGANLNFTNGLTGACNISGTAFPTTIGTPDICGGTYQYQWTNFDVCNNFILYTQNVTVIPTPLPTYINPPGDISVACNAVNLNPTSLSFSNNKSGNCAITGSIPSIVNPNYTECGGVVDYIWSYTDVCNRTILHTQTANVAPAPPAAFVNPPANITVSCQGVPPPNMPLNYSNNATSSSCVISGSVMPTESGTYDGCGGVVYHDWEFTDDCNRTINYSQKITVQPAPLPTFINPPQNITISCTQAGLLDLIPELNYTNNAQGFCLNAGTVEGVYTGQYSACGGILYVTYNLDACGTLLKHIQKITVQAAPDPHWIDPPADITLACGVPFPQPATLFFTNDLFDNCDISGEVVGTYFIDGSIGTYSWEYTNPCNNKKITHKQKITATIKPDLTLVPSSASICLGQSYDLKNITITDKKGTSPTITYHSATPADPTNKLPSTVVSPTKTTTYYILGVNGTGCSDEEPFTVTVDTALSAGTGKTGTLCFASTGVNLFNYLTGPYYPLGVWVDPAKTTIDISNPKNVSFSGITPGTYSFLYIVPKVGGCPPDTTSISLTLLQEVKIEVQAISCTPDLLTYNVTINTNGYNITTSIGTITNQGNNIIQIGPIPVDSSLTITATDLPSGCKAVVFINPPNCNCPQVDPPVSDGNKIICFGDPIPTLSVMVNADETANWYDKAFGGTLVQANSLTYKPNVSAPGIYQYYVEAKNTLYTNCVSATKTLVQLEIVAGPSVTMAHLYACDADGNGHAPFDLTQAQAQINASPSLSFKYYLTLADANAEVNPLPTTYTNITSGIQTIYVVVTNTTGCKSNTTLQLHVYPKIVIATVLKGETCLGDNDGSITVNATGGTGSLEYSIDNSTWVTTNVFSPLSAGNYTVYVRDTASCNSSKSVTVAPGLLLTPDVFTIVCNSNGTDSDGTDDFYVMTFTITNNKANVGTYTVSDGTNVLGTFAYNVSKTINIPADGKLYTITFTDVTTGCKLTQNIGPLTSCSTNCKISFNTLTKTCSDNGTNTDPSDDVYTITFSATVINGGPSDSYSLIINGVSQGTFTYGQIGMLTLPADGTNVLITLIDTDDGQCQATKSTGSLIPCSSTCLINPVVSNIKCNDSGTINDPLDDTFTYEITVSGVNISSKWYISGTPTTEYNYNEVISFGPYLIADGDINIILVDKADATCNSSLTITAPPVCSEPCILEYTNLIIGDCNNNNTGATTLDDFFAASFVVNATSGSYDKFTVTYNGKVWGPFNYGENITIDSLPANGNVLNLQINDVSNSGCLLTITATQDACSSCPETIDAGPPFNLDCIIKSATLQGTATAAGQILWTGPNNYEETILTPVADVPGTYILTVTFPFQCVAIDSTVITIDASVPVADAGFDKELTCIIKSVTLDGNGSSKGPNLKYEWTDINGNVLGTGLTLVVTQPGEYYLQVIDPVNNCNSPLSLVTVTENIEEPTADIFADPSEILNCKVDAIKLFTTDQPNVVFTWTQNGVSSTGSQIIVNKGGLVTLTAVNNLNGCTAENMITIQELIEYPIVDVQEPKRLNCKNTSVVIDATNSQDGTNIMYHWYNSNNVLIPGETSDTLEVSTAGTYYFEAVDTSLGCQNIDTVLVISDASYPVVNAGPDINLPCQVVDVSLNASLQGNLNNYNIVWSSQIGTVVNGSNTLTPAVSGGGTYTIVVTDLLSECVSSDSLFVKTNFDAPKIDALSIDSVRCLGENNGRINIDKVSGGTPPISYTINGKPSNNSGVFYPLSAGIYTIQLTDANGCVSDTVVEIAPGHFIDLQITPSILLTLGDSAFLEAIVNVPESELASIKWTPNSFLSCDSCLITQIQAISSQQYKITVVDKYGCRAYDFIYVAVEKGVHVYIPNVFSPEGNGINDFFTLYGDKNVKKINEVRIFDRWGGMMFYKENFDPNQEQLGWDGKTKGIPVVQGVYVYYFIVEFIDGTTELYKGDVTVIR